MPASKPPRSRSGPTDRTPVQVRARLWWCRLPWTLKPERGRTFGGADSGLRSGLCCGSVGLAVDIVSEVRMLQSMWKMTWWSLITVSCGLVLPSTATAGTYQVTQTCGAWQPFNNAPSRVAVYTECPKLIVRNVGGAFNSGPGQEGRWEFFAPAGTSVERAFLGGSIGAYSGWQATILSTSGTVIENCPGFFCPGGAKGYGSTYSFANSAGIYLRVRCGADRCPNNEGLKV